MITKQHKITSFRFFSQSEAGVLLYSNSRRASICLRYLWL